LAGAWAKGNLSLQSPALALSMEAGGQSGLGTGLTHTVTSPPQAEKSRIPYLKVYRNCDGVVKRMDEVYCAAPTGKPKSRSTERRQRQTFPWGI
jgi:hypothetical protein